MSIRAQAVAEVLWELKKAEKLGTYSLVASRAGFSAGTNGRTMITCLKKIRREWPHLEWWRVLEDETMMEKQSEQVSQLESNGFSMEASGSDEKMVKPAELEEHLIDWSVVDGVDQSEEAEETEEVAS
jgi:alkylated DNA nucleotide flippase Atl1